MLLMVLSIACTVIILHIYHSQCGSQGKFAVPSCLRSAVHPKTDECEHLESHQRSNEGMDTSSLGSNGTQGKVVDHLEKQEDEEDKSEKWIRLAQWLDRLFLVFLASMTTITSVALLGIYPLSRPETVEAKNVS